MDNKDLSILIIEDDQKSRKFLSKIIELDGYNVTIVENIQDALIQFEKESFAIVLSDVKLPDGNGIDLIPKLKSINPEIEIVVLTAYGNIKDGVIAIKSGAFDYLEKGNEAETIPLIISRAVEKYRLKQQVNYLQNRINARSSFDKIIGHSKGIINTIEFAKKVSPTDTNVLLLGETGTGKELFAEAIHQASKRSDKPFLAINCSAIPHELQESELFGHCKGSFTGAINNKKGVFEEANHGTIFLDEVGEMHPDLQPKLLRVLETKIFNRIGDTKSISTDVRVISATNKVFSDEESFNNFRKDLFYRLNAFTIELPPLRERIGDIELLATYFMKNYCEHNGKQILLLEKEFKKQLIQYSWPGNIRELKNVIERAIILAEKDLLSKDLLPPHIIDNSNTFQNDQSSYDLNSIEKNHILKVLKITQNNKTTASNMLGIGLTTLYRKLKEYNIE